MKVTVIEWACDNCQQTAMTRPPKPSARVTMPALPAGWRAYLSAGTGKFPAGHVHLCGDCQPVATGSMQRIRTGDG